LKKNIKIKIFYHAIEKEFSLDKNKVIIFDHPSLSPAILESANKFYRKTIVIDDENYLDHYDCDLLINQNPYSKQLKYKTRKNTKKLLGSRYSILKNNFFKSNFIKPQNSIKKILLVFGGTDIKNYYSSIIPKLNDYKVYIPSALSLPKKKFKSFQKKNNVFLINHSNIKKIIIDKKINLIISCCGSILYELFSFKMPVVGFKCSNDQINAYKFLSKNKSIIKSNLNDIKIKLKNLSNKKRLALIKNSQKYYNFNGKYLIYKEIKKIIK